MILSPNVIASLAASVVDPAVSAGAAPGIALVAASSISPGRRRSRPYRGAVAAVLLGSLSAISLAGCGGDVASPSTNDVQFAAEERSRSSGSAGRACELATDDGSVTVGSGLPGDPALPEPSSGYRLGKTVVSARSYMVVSANPHATRAGCEILKNAGSAIDAAVAVQAVLGLVEPQSSGLGGGTFVMHFDARSGKVTTYDGRETAPAAATENYLRWISDTEQTAPLPNARASGRSIGTPGTVRVLDLAHREHGTLPWPRLFNAAIGLADDGFAISGRMAEAIAGARTNLLRDAEAAAYFLNADGSARELGTTIRNPAYAATLRAIATGGPDAFYTGEIAQSIVDKIRVSSGGPAAPVLITPGLTTIEDLASYRPVKREPVCIDYRAYRVCGMGPPSSGGIAVAQTLGILETFTLSAHAPAPVNADGGKPTVMGVHLVSEAERLAYADRNAYVADADFVPLPGGSPAALLDKTYLRSRATLIREDRSLGIAPAGVFPAAARFASNAAEGKGTSHVSIVDRHGNAVSMTTTIESGLGSFHFTRGFLLNNELTDFSAVPEQDGRPIANRVQAGKRPRSSMAPTLVFRKTADGSTRDLVMATGSPGGATIIQFVVKTLVGVLDWGLDAQQATSLTNFGSSNTATTGIGGENPNIDATADGAYDPLVTGLRALGHTVSVNAQSSGVSTIVRMIEGGKVRLEGGADPRREGIVLGDPLRSDSERERDRDAHEGDDVRAREVAGASEGR